MTTYPLSRPLTVEPPTWPADDAPYFDCEVCGFETDRLNEDRWCPDCVELYGHAKEELVRLVAELRQEVRR